MTPKGMFVRNQQISRWCLGFLGLASLCDMALATTYTVSTAAGLTAVLNASTSKLKAGDKIVLLPGTYKGNFVATIPGKKSFPITLSGSAAAILTNPAGYGFHLKTSYWKLTGFTVEKSKKGIILDGASHNLLDQLTVRSVSEEGIHLRAFSSNNVIQKSKVYSTGLGSGMAALGEAIYLGSAISNWDTHSGGQPDKSNANCVAYNTLGPGISAEGIDIKEGTSGGLIIGNTFDRPSMTEQSVKGTSDGKGAGGDSFIDAKGDGYLIYANGGKNSLKNPNMAAGFQAHQKIDSGNLYGNNNKFQKNTVSLNGTGAYGFDIDVATFGNKVCADNIVSGTSKGVSNTGTVFCATPAVAPACPNVLTN